MALRCLLFCLLVAGSQAASIQRNIPVEVRYDEPVPSLAVAESSEPVVNPVKNLEEKPQLSGEEIKDVLKHVPVQEEISPEANFLDTTTKAEEKEPFNKLGEAPKQEPVTESDSLSPLEFLQRAEEIAITGLKQLREKINKLEGPKPTSEEWDAFELRVLNIFKAEKERAPLRIKLAEKQNLISSIISSFTGTANGFISQDSGNANPQASEDEASASSPQPPNGSNGNIFQNLWGTFTGGIQNISNQIQNLGSNGGSNGTVLGDENTTGAPGFVSSIFNNIQQAFGGLQNNTGGNQAQNFLVGAANQFNNFVSGGSTAAPGTQGDEGSSQRPPFQQAQQIIQNFQGSIGNAVNQFLGRPPSGTSGDPGTQQPGGPNFISQIGNNIGQAFQGVFGIGQGNGTASNPIATGIQNVGNQINQFVSGQGGPASASPVVAQADTPQVSPASPAPVSESSAEPQVTKAEKPQEESKPTVAATEAVKSEDTTTAKLEVTEAPQPAVTKKEEMMEAVE